MEVPKIFSSREIAQSISEFVQMGQGPMMRIADFNNDVKTLEKLFKSFGLNRFYITVCEVHDELQDYEESLWWDPETERIMYDYRVAENAEPPEYKPILQSDFDTRKAAITDSWLVLLFREAKECLRKQNEFYEQHVKVKVAG